MAKKATSRVRYRSGDIFQMPFSDGSFGYGRILLDLRPLAKAGLFSDRCALAGMYGASLLIQIYRTVAKKSLASVESLRSVETLLGQFLQKDQIYRGVFPIVGNLPVMPEEIDFPTLYQPVHTTRLREGAVYFKQDGDKLTGYSITPKGMGLSGSSSWKDGRTEFRTVTFADGKLVFEFDVKEIAHGWELGLKEKATIRVEAKLKDGRLIGKWGLFLKDGTEPFRGEWEAVRPKEKAPEKK